MYDLHRQVIVKRLQQVLITFFVLAALFLVVVYVADPSIYTKTLLLEPSPADRYSLPVTLFLLCILVFIAVGILGVVRHWRWLFWVLLVAFGFMVLEVPATILQLIGVVPSLFPVWYSLCRMGVSVIAVIIAVWMIQIYRRYRVWVLGSEKKGDLHS